MLRECDSRDIYERCLRKEKFLAVFTKDGKEQYALAPFFNFTVRDWDHTGYQHDVVYAIEDALNRGVSVVYYNLV